MPFYSVLNRIIALHEIETPDGRPLYAYRCPDSLYEAIKTNIPVWLTARIQGQSLPGFDALFCFFAAEAWKRNYNGNPSYATIFDCINYPVPDQNLIRDWIAKGILYWGRELKVINGQTRYLITIACEGGLPLRMLENEQGAITAFFKSLLKDIYQKNDNDYDILTAAEQIATLTNLSTAWRNKTIYNVSKELIHSIIYLQSKIPDTIDNPLFALDQVVPDWRNRLPLSAINDNILNGFIKTLLGEVKELSNIGKPLNWQHIIIKNHQNWSLTKTLDLPRELSGETLNAWTNTENLPVRMTIVLESATATKIVSHLTRIQGSGIEAKYRCDQNLIRLSEADAADDVRLYLADGTDQYEIPAKGGTALGENVWSFIEKSGEIRLFSEGTAHTKTSCIYLAIPPNSQIQNTDNMEAAGKLAYFDRALFKLQGETTIVLVDGERIDVRSGCQEDLEQEFMFEGPTSCHVLNKKPVYIGVPRLQLIKNGIESEIPRLALAWRPVSNSQNGWLTDLSQCFGTIWIRYANSNGTLIHRQKLDILPPNFNIVVERIGNSNQSGILVIRNAQNPNIVAAPSAEYSTKVSNVDGVIKVEVTLNHGILVPKLRLNLTWNAGSLTLELPMPCEGSAFVTGEQIITGQRVAVDRLAGIQSIAQSQVAGGFYIETTLRTINGGHYPHLWLPPQRLQLNQSAARYQYELYQLQERLMDLMSMTNQLDVLAELNVTKNGQSRALLRVSRFDISLEKDQDNRRVFFERHKSERLGDGWEDRVIVKIIPLWNLSATPMFLEREDNESDFGWKIPEALELGPYWVLGYDGLWPRFRPLLWVEKSNQAQPEANTIEHPHSLAEAIKIPKLDDRRYAISEILKSMGRDSRHTDWPKLYDHIDFTRDYPATAFDVLKILVYYQQTLCLTLLKSTEARLDSVWCLSHQLPFSWHLMPIDIWMEATSLHVNSLLHDLSSIPGGEDIVYKIICDFRRLIISQGHKFLGLILSWIVLKLFPNRPPDIDNVFMDLAANPDFTEDRIQTSLMNLQGRHHGEEWPHGPNTLTHVNLLNANRQFHGKAFRKPVLCAPFVAAKICLEGGNVSNELLFELGRLRNFDREWFDQAYYFELCLGLRQQLAH